jgi:hypothetical protein
VPHPRLGQEYFYVTPTQPIKVRQVVCTQTFGVSIVDKDGKKCLILDTIEDINTHEKFSYVILYGKKMLLNTMDDIVELFKIILNKNPHNEKQTILNEIHEFLLSTKKTNPEYFL